MQDDYVKFIRFAQWKIDHVGEGVLGFITNHGYLDNPTFRGMRKSLMTSFDEIYILDLHGNSKKKEKAPDGSKDENVFDIQQGVAIAFFIKHKKGKSKSFSHSELFGLREDKYNWLTKHTIKNIKWTKIVPHPEFYQFIPTDNKLANHYYSFSKITEIFPVNNVGITTARDRFVIDYDRKQLEKRIKQFRDSNLDDEIIKKTYDLKENENWKIIEQREKLRKDHDWQDAITQILYRPFDIQWIFYHDTMIERSRKEIMRHMQEENLALCVGRQGSVTGSNNYDIVFVSEDIVDMNLFRRGGELVFPLYLFQKTESKKKSSYMQLMMFEPDESYIAVRPNISRIVFEELKKNFKKEPTPEEIFYYVYAILYSKTYRTKYAEFLKIDFPYVPFSKNYKLFNTLAKLGNQLAGFHLLKAKELEKIAQIFSIKGNNEVEKLKYEGEKVWINKTQYFNDVKEEVWQYQVGGYQVCEKWLKDRKGRILTYQEIQTYSKIITALSKTIELQTEIDKLYDSVEKTLS